MKIRAILLIALMIGGAFMMVQSIEESNENSVTELLESMNQPFHSLIFTKPQTYHSNAQKWVANDPSEIEILITFLQNYHVRKLNSTDIDIEDDIEEFSISLEDRTGKMITIIITEDLIIQNSNLYYEIVDGPLDIEWLVYFFSSNQI